MTEMTIGKEKEKTGIPAADIALVVEHAVEEKKSSVSLPRDVVIVPVKQIIAAAYVDPIEEEYKTMKRNIIGGLENRESAEGIASLHALFSFAGDMPEL